MQVDGDMEHQIEMMQVTIRELNQNTEAVLAIKKAIDDLEAKRREEEKL